MASEAPSPLPFRCCTHLRLRAVQVSKAGRGGVGAQSAPIPLLPLSPVAAAPFSTPSNKQPRSAVSARVLAVLLTALPLPREPRIRGYHGVACHCPARLDNLSRR